MGTPISMSDFTPELARQEVYDKFKNKLNDANITKDDFLKSITPKNSDEENKLRDANIPEDGNWTPEAIKKYNAGISQIFGDNIISDTNSSNATDNNASTTNNVNDGTKEDKISDSNYSEETIKRFNDDADEAIKKFKEIMDTPDAVKIYNDEKKGNENSTNIIDINSLSNENNDGEWDDSRIAAFNAQVTKNIGIEEWQPQKETSFGEALGMSTRDENMMKAGAWIGACAGSAGAFMKTGHPLALVASMASCGPLLGEMVLGTLRADDVISAVKEEVFPDTQIPVFNDSTTTKDSVFNLNNFNFNENSSTVANDNFELPYTSFLDIGTANNYYDWGNNGFLNNSSSDNYFSLYNNDNAGFSLPENTEIENSVFGTSYANNFADEKTSVFGPVFA